MTLLALEDSVTKNHMGEGGGLANFDFKAIVIGFLEIKLSRHTKSGAGGPALPNGT